MIAGANRHHCPLLGPTLEKLARFGSHLPEKITVHLDAGHDSRATLLDELGCDAVISQKGFPLQAGARWVVQRTNSWHSRGFKKLLVCTEPRVRVIEALIALAGAIILDPTARTHRLDHPPLDHPPHPPTMTYPRNLEVLCLQYPCFT